MTTISLRVTHVEVWGLFVADEVFVSLVEGFTLVGNANMSPKQTHVKEREV